MRASTLLILMLLSATALADVVVPVDEVESYVNIRSAPDGSADPVGRLHKSKPRPHVRTLEGWHEVLLEDGTTGFVSSDWSVIRPDDEEIASVDDAAEDADTDAIAASVESVDSPDVVRNAADTESLAQESSEPEAVTDVTPASAPPAVESTEAPALSGAVDTNVTAAAVEKTPVATRPETHAVDASEPEMPQAAGTTVGPAGPPGPAGPQGPPGPPGDGAVKGTENFLVKFKKPTVGGNSQIYDDGTRVGIGTTEPAQKLEVNGSIQINDKTTSVAGVMMTQIGGETGYILHNQASTMTIGAGSVDRITIDGKGNIGFGVNRPEHPLQLASGAYVSAGGVWTNSSSRARKENIESLTLEQALEALSQLEPVAFNYKSDADEMHLGFIAEDVPDLVATVDRESLSPMDVIAVLTRVVQEQQQKIESLERRLDSERP